MVVFWIPAGTFHTELFYSLHLATTLPLPWGLNLLFVVSADSVIACCSLMFVLGKRQPTPVKILQPCPSREDALVRRAQPVSLLGTWLIAYHARGPAALMWCGSPSCVQGIFCFPVCFTSASWFLFTILQFVYLYTSF